MCVWCMAAIFLWHSAQDGRLISGTAVFKVVWTYWIWQIAVMSPPPDLITTEKTMQREGHRAALWGETTPDNRISSVRPQLTLTYNHLTYLEENRGGCKRLELFYLETWPDISSDCCYLSSFSQLLTSQDAVKWNEMITVCQIPHIHTPCNLERSSRTLPLHLSSPPRLWYDDDIDAR